MEFKLIKFPHLQPAMFDHNSDVKPEIFSGLMASTTTHNNHPIMLCPPENKIFQLNSLNVALSTIKRATLGLLIKHNVAQFHHENVDKFVKSFENNKLLAGFT